MINFEFRYASDPIDFRRYGTDTIREKFLMPTIFARDEINLTYSMYDRYIVGGAMPVNEPLHLSTIPYLKADYFLERRELGVINIGGKGSISVDGIIHKLDKREAIYIGKGSREVIFKSESENPALFYLNSAPAHKQFPIKKVGKENAEIVQLGDDKYANKRVLYKLIVNSIVDSCQLQMGITELVEGNVWNTMPAHTHERRMEAYFYFDLEEGQSVCHFMGQPQHTRHLFVKNHQAILSPEWSIHSGAGTSNYSFIWGMAGENLDYSDMDICPPDQLK